MKWDNKKVLSEIKRLHKLYNRMPVKRDSNSLYFMSRKFYGTWNNALRATGYKVKDFQNPTVPKISPELAYFVGLVITDGHLRYDKKRRIYSISVYNSYPNEKDIIIKLIKYLFNYNPTIRGRKYSFSKLTNYEIVISSKKLVLFIHEKFNIPVGAKSKIIQIPIIFAENDNLFYSFLRGVIDGDGCVGKTISISSGSKLFLEQLLYRFKDIKLTCSIRKSPTSYNLLIWRQKDIRNLYQKTYTNANYYYKRKKERYETELKSFLNK